MAESVRCDKCRAAACHGYVYKTLQGFFVLLDCPIDCLCHLEDA